MGRVRARFPLIRLALVAALWLGIAEVLWQCTRHVADWFVMTDELYYERLAISVDRLHTPFAHVHGQSVSNINQL